MQRNSKIIIAIALLFLGLRFLYISGNNVFFFFDQARDATVVRDMVANLDIKIQGPSVSGTNDSVYHGVLYYYVIAPLYFLFAGNPFYVSLELVIINLIGLYLTYELGRVVFKSKQVGIVAAFLQSISLLSIHQSTWLSNPNLSAIALPAVYLLSWKIFFDSTKRSQRQKYILFILWGLSLAVAVQVALQNITLFGSILLLFVFGLKSKRFTLERQTLINFAAAAGVFLLGISSMILTQFLMYRRGILSSDSLNLSHHEVGLLESIPKIISAYTKLLQMYLTPYSSNILFLISLFAFIFLIIRSKYAKQQIIWIVSFFTAPIWLLSWHFRDPNHSFIGLEILVSLLFANAVVQVWKNKKQDISFRLLIVALLIFLLTNLSALIYTKTNKIQYFGIQKGAFLNEQLSLIDKVYSTLEQPFSFSSLTAPYAINTTWDYLFSWYGQSKYQYVPEYVGILQSGFVTTNTLSESPEPLRSHALILEPDTTLSNEITSEFIVPIDNRLRIKYDFGTLQLYILIQERLNGSMPQN